VYTNHDCVRFQRYLYSGRNQSSLDVEACARWLLTNESLFSDLAVMEIDLPTGYLQVRQAVDDYVDAGLIPNLKRARISPRIAVFMFDHVSQSIDSSRFSLCSSNPNSTYGQLNPDLSERNLHSIQRRTMVSGCKQHQMASGQDLRA
jgi:hypothetical protein